MNSYVICTTPRSGSNLLCDYLSSTGLFGSPAEFMNPRTAKHFADRWGCVDESGVINFGAYLDRLLKVMRTSNGVFGMKILHDDYYHFRAFPAFRQFLERTKLIYLTRKDKVRQAVSYYIASRTGQWIHTDIPNVSVDAIEFDSAAIETEMAMLIEHDVRWRVFFAMLNVTPLEIYYEDIINDPRGVVSEVGRFLNVDCERATIETRLQSQSSEFSVAFADSVRVSMREREFRVVDQISYQGFQFIC